MIIFRTDGNETVGSGHVMRCLSIAQACKRKGHRCCFVTADSNYQEKIQQEGFQVWVLQSDYRYMEQELEQFAKILQKEKPKTVVVDSYFVNQEYFCKLKQYAKVFYIDDLMDRAHPVDGLINYNIYARKEFYVSLYKKVGMSLPELYLGTTFVPLRKEFSDLPVRQVNRLCENVLISTGGADPIGLGLTLLQALEKVKNREPWSYHIIAGSKNRNIEAMEKLAAKLPNVQLHKNVEHMAELMLKCDIAVSASGSTLYELCACGVPTICYSLADNQRQGLEAFGTLGIMENLQDLRFAEDAPRLILNAISNMAEQYERRENMAEKMATVVDGKGADRLADHLLSLGRISH